MARSGQQYKEQGSCEKSPFEFIALEVSHLFAASPSSPDAIRRRLFLNLQPAAARALICLLGAAVAPPCKVIDANHIAALLPLLLRRPQFSLRAVCTKLEGQVVDLEKTAIPTADRLIHEKVRLPTGLSAARALFSL